MGNDGSDRIQLTQLMGQGRDVKAKQRSPSNRKSQVYILQFLTTTIKTDIKILTCGRGAHCSGYKAPLGLLVSPCELIFTCEIICWSLQVPWHFPGNFLNCLVKKVLTAAKRAVWQAEGAGASMGPSLPSPHHTKKRC